MLRTHLYSPLGLDAGDGGVDVFGHHVAAIQHAARHVFPVARVAFHQLVCGLETPVRNLSHTKLLVIGLLSRHNGRVDDERVVDPRVRHQVGLELQHVYVESPVEPE